MIASIEHVDVLKRGAKVNIDANCNVNSLIEKYVAIDEAPKSNMLEGIVNPLKFGPIVVSL